jgi:hypothetical protein
MPPLLDRHGGRQRVQRRLCLCRPTGVKCAVSSPPCLPRLLPAGAVAGRGLHPLEKRRLVTAHVEYGHTAVNAGVVELGLATTACASSSSDSVLQATSLGRINRPACRNRRSSSLPEAILENLSLCMRKFGKYLAISDNTESHFPLSDHLLRRANRRTI